MKPILNLYTSRHEAIDAFNMASLEDKSIVRYREMRIDTESTMTYFKWYSSYEEARVNELCAQWGEINFFVDLPIEVKSHFLSRIRWSE